MMQTERIVVVTAAASEDAETYFSAFPALSENYPLYNTLLSGNATQPYDLSCSMPQYYAQNDYYYVHRRTGGYGRQENSSTGTRDKRSHGKRREGRGGGHKSSQSSTQQQDIVSDVLKSSALGTPTPVTASSTPRKFSNPSHQRQQQQRQQQPHNQQHSQHQQSERNSSSSNSSPTPSAPASPKPTRVKRKPYASRHDASSTTDRLPDTQQADISRSTLQQTTPSRNTLHPSSSSSFKLAPRHHSSPRGTPKAARKTGRDSEASSRQAGQGSELSSRSGGVQRKRNTVIIQASNDSGISLLSGSRRNHARRSNGYKSTVDSGKRGNSRTLPRVKGKLLITAPSAGDSVASIRDEKPWKSLPSLDEDSCIERLSDTNDSDSEEGGSNGKKSTQSVSPVLQILQLPLASVLPHRPGARSRFVDVVFSSDGALDRYPLPADFVGRSEFADFDLSELASCTVLDSSSSECLVQDSEPGGCKVDGGDSSCCATVDANGDSEVRLHENKHGCVGSKEAVNSSGDTDTDNVAEFVDKVDGCFIGLLSGDEVRSNGDDGESIERLIPPVSRQASTASENSVTVADSSILTSLRQSPTPGQRGTCEDIGVASEDMGVASENSCCNCADRLFEISWCFHRSPDNSCHSVSSLSDSAIWANNCVVTRGWPHETDPSSTVAAEPSELIPYLDVPGCSGEMSDLTESEDCSESGVLRENMSPSENKGYGGHSISRRQLTCSHSTWDYEVALNYECRRGNSRRRKGQGFLSEEAMRLTFNWTAYENEPWCCHPSDPCEVHARDITTIYVRVASKPQLACTLRARVWFSEEGVVDSGRENEGKTNPNHVSSCESSGKDVPSSDGSGDGKGARSACGCSYCQRYGDIEVPVRVCARCGSALDVPAILDAPGYDSSL